MLQRDISQVNTNNGSFKKNQANEVEVKLLEVHRVEFEISDIVMNFNVHIVQKFNIEDKMIFVVIIQIQILVRHRIIAITVFLLN